MSAKIIGFFESFGAGFPILIGIFAADVAEHEQNAGRFQNLLSQPRKTTAFWSKVILLLFLGLFSVVLTAVIFGAGFRVIADDCDIGMITYLTTALMMWCGGIPLYIVQTIIAFNFEKGASVGAGSFCRTARRTHGYGFEQACVGMCTAVMDGKNACHVFARCVWNTRCSQRVKKGDTNRLRCHNNEFIVLPIMGFPL